MFLPSLSGVPYIENINICLNTQRFISAIAKDIAMALTGSLEGRRVGVRSAHESAAQAQVKDCVIRTQNMLYLYISMYAKSVRQYSKRKVFKVSTGLLHHRMSPVAGFPTRPLSPGGVLLSARV